MSNQLKTQPKPDSVEEFINSWPEEQAQEGRLLCAIMKEATGQKPVLWSKKIIGFGTYGYKYASGRCGDWTPVAFAPRKGGMTLYLMDGKEYYKEKLASMTVSGSGKSCVYLKKLKDIDLEALGEIISESYKRTVEAYGTK